MLMIGTDEAGYGPNLGPLTIAATVWDVKGVDREVDLYDLLGESVSRSWSQKNPSSVPIADSKQLYKPGLGWSALEYGLWAAFAACGKSIDRWQQAWQMLSAGKCPLPAVPWYRDFDIQLPRDAQPEQLDPLNQAFAESLRSHGVRLVDVRAVAIFPGEFNDRVESAGSKGAVLSQATLHLIQSITESLPNDTILVHCDKHGGRNKYGPLLQQTFPDYLVEVHEESRASSRYRFGPPERRTEIRFVAKGEHFLPSALASMTAKYLRELAMQAFNEYWMRQVPELKPTAGYPVDALRFKKQIAAKQKLLGIDDHDVWRNR